MSEKRSASPGGGRPLRAAVIGAGMAGILATIRLRAQGVECTVFEKADRVGGTWRENTYPGVACDVSAHWYTYSFARNPHWERLMAEGWEIQDYFERTAKEFGVLPLVRFNDEVVRLAYEGGQWKVTTASGYNDQFDVAIIATGVLHHPNIPRLKGIDSFKGATFHSSRWDHSVPFEDRRIGVIGTGSTAAQLTAALVPKAEIFHLFQRTAQWILPRPNVSYTEEEKALYRSDPAALEALVEEYRSKTISGYATAVIDQESPELALITRLCEENLATVRDPELRRRLTPDYRVACKRLVISSEFYDAIQQPNAHLVTSAIECIEPEGVRTSDGELHKLDVLVLATGFHADAFIRPTKVIGRGGVDLDAVWEDHPVAYLSVTVPDFPNLFMIGGPNSPVGNFSLIEISENQVGYILQLLAGLQRGEYREICATPDAMQRFESERRKAAEKTIWMTGCKSWYLDKHGVPASWTFSYQRFIDEMAAPRMADYAVR